MPIILASGSPRRRELLLMLGVKDFMIIPPETDETLSDSLPPAEQACLISKGKARKVAAARGKSDIIAAADTIVVKDGRVFGKPANDGDAFYMLSELSGSEHAVFTGVTVIKGNTEMTEVEMTAVRFRKLSEREIKAYVSSGESSDKAGAYGVQGPGALFVESIRGDFYNVMGLPLCRLGLMLKKLGVDLI